MAKGQVTASEAPDKPANPIREHLLAVVQHVENLEFVPAMESLVQLKKVRGNDVEPKHMMALINPALDGLSRKAFRPLRDYLVLLLRKEAPVPPEKLIDLLGLVGIGEERIQATAEFVAEATDFIGQVLGDCLTMRDEDEKRLQEEAESQA